MRYRALVAVAIVIVASVIGATAGPGAAATALPGAPTAAAAGGDDPIGNMEGPAVRLADLFFSYRYDVYGWAADSNTPGQPVRVHIYVNGQFDREITTGEPRPDVATVYPWAGANTGFAGAGLAPAV
jgi:hypothetical protein